MTGPEHYRQAERALHIATQANDVAAALHIAAAQAHAILALAAATALNDGNGGTTVTDYRAWKAAASAEISETPSDGQCSNCEGSGIACSWCQAASQPSTITPGTPGDPQ